MSRPRGKINVVCQNSKCGFYRREKGKDIIKRGFNRAGHRQYFCLHCNTYFVETKGTPLYNKKLSERKIKAICRELVEKKGIRAIERTLHVNRNTVCSLIDDLATHAANMTDYLVHDVGLKEHEVDEMWTFIKKKKRKLSFHARNGLRQVSSGFTSECCARTLA